MTLNILQIISCGYAAGGAEKSVLLLRDALTEQGHRVHIISSDHGDAGLPHFSDTEFAEITREGSGNLRRALDHLWYRESYRVIRRVIAEFSPDVIHFHTMGQLSPSALFAARGVPTVLTVHGPEEYLPRLLKWYFAPELFRQGRIGTGDLTLVGRIWTLFHSRVQRPLYRIAIRRHVGLIVAPSRYMEAELKAEQLGAPVVQIYNGIELPAHRDLEHCDEILYVGRLERVKGVELLVPALEQVSRSLDGVVLHVVGDGPMRAAIESEVVRRDLSERVQVHGWLTGDRLLGAYASSTVVVIPSIWPENLPTVCIEALAIGRPVVCSNTGGMPELVEEGVTGSVVAPNDTEALARSVTGLLTAPDLGGMSRAASASVSQFAIATFVSQVLVAYTELREKT